ncbi:MAG: DUF2188 domain-containing protein [Bacilli bacterium]|jgi:hypothetical protein|nr:DUF2188 domain-containing protein [Bacilli bacterium]
MAEKTGGTYLVQKRKADGLWTVQNMGSDKVIKTFKTKAEADAFVKERAERNGKGVVARASKGENKGKFRKS